MKTKFFGAFNKQNVTDVVANKIENSQQPHFIELEMSFHYEDETSQCMAWGNFYDLRKTCNDLGISLTENPAEAIVKSAKQEKYSNIEAFYGEFTFILFQNEKIIIGRDLIGAGLPVFYTNDYFSNSIDDFKRIADFEFSLDPTAVRTFLHIGTPIPPQTIINGVKQLAAGEYLVFSKNEIKTYFIFSYQKYDKQFSSLKISEQEAVIELERLHKNAIKRRIADKQNIALLMSGGYDSGGNVAALRDLYDGKVSGYSIGFKDDAWSELPLARLLAQKFGINFSDYQIDGSEIDDLPVIMRSLGTPFQENGIMVNYTVMKRVNEDNNDIILGGDGNDQVYGTAMQQVALHYYSSKFFLNPVQSVISSLTSGTHQKLLSRVNFHNNRILHAGNYTSFGFKASELKKMLKYPDEKLMMDVMKRNHLKAKSFDDLYKIHTYYKDFIHDGNHLIIFKASNMARLFNQHLSFPYMDKDSIEFIMQLPREMRFSGTPKEIAKGHGSGKYLHKKYLKPKLPKEITERKKQGGFAPLPIFFKDKNRRTMIYNIIRKSKLSGDIFDKNYLEAFFQDLESIIHAKDAWFWHQQTIAFKLFNLLSLTIWWEVHFKNHKGTTLSDFD
ncbi:MAG: hypothetical protein K9H16_05565 [Bacteroidales bacterium]|nr:hypothetical protein [Bacteroidales bacterium]